MAFGLLTGTSGIQPGFLSRLEALRRALPNNLGSQIGIRSGYRSPQHQAELFARAVQRYGSVAAARKWVAPPGRSQHNLGNAVDLSYGSPAAMRAAHEMAGQFGLVFPMSYENWHIEPAGARGGKSPPSAAVGTGPAVAADAGPGLANMLADAASPEAGSSSGIGLGGGGGGGGSPGIVGDPSPIPIPDLRTSAEDALPQDAAAPAQAPGPDAGQLAGLFTLPTIGLLPGDQQPQQPGADLVPVLPGQAKPLARKVWK